MTHICVSNQTNHHWFRWWLADWPAPSHNLNQCWNIVNLTHRNKLQWNLNWNSYIFIQENAFKNVIWKMAAILSRPQCVKPFGLLSVMVNRIRWVELYFICWNYSFFWLTYFCSMGSVSVLGLVTGIDHDTVCAGVVGTAIWHSTSCAGCCRPAGTSAVPDCSTNHDSADHISGQFLFYHDHNFTKSKGNLRFRRLVPLFVPIGVCVTTHDDRTASDVTIGMWHHNQHVTNHERNGKPWFSPPK